MERALEQKKIGAVGEIGLDYHYDFSPREAQREAFANQLDLAIAAKSNAGYNAFNTAMAFVKKDKSKEVPVHLRNAPTKLMKELGYGHAYRYAHDEPDAYAAGETYFPDGMAEPGWYQPVPRGLESKIADKLAWLRELDRKAGKG